MRGAKLRFGGKRVSMVAAFRVVVRGRETESEPGSSFPKRCANFGNERQQPAAKPPIVPPPPKVTARAMRPLWRDLILRVWGADPLQCPCCQATMHCVGTIVRPGEVQFFLRLHGLWEGIIDLPPPPDPPFDIETFEPIAPPWQAIREWIPDDDAEPSFDFFDQRPDSGKSVEIRREDGSILVLDFD